jgi:hypothetical protein
MAYWLGLGHLLEPYLGMLGILSVHAECKAPGIVPGLSGLILEYSGNYMTLLLGVFSLFR